MYIYCIENSINGKKYIGQTVKPLKLRIKQHRNEARRGEIRHLYSAMRKYGDENFTISLIEETTDLNSRECYWIDALDTKRNGYNETDGGEGLKGFKHSEESRIKMKDNFTQERRAQLSNQTKEGMKRWWDNLSQFEKEDYIKRCQKRPEGWIPPKGWHFNHSEETKKRMSIAKLGHIKSEETCRRISESKKGQLAGELNPMKREDVKEKHRKACTGRRIAKRPDGTRYWVYPNVVG